MILSIIDTSISDILIFLLHNKKQSTLFTPGKNRCFHAYHFKKTDRKNGTVLTRFLECFYNKNKKINKTINYKCKKCKLVYSKI